MNWVTNQTKITASGIIETNRNLTITKAHGHQGWGWRYIDYYWWNERHTDETFMWYGSSRSAGCEHQLELYRLENNSWVHKGTWHGSKNQLDGSYGSRGRGAYHMHFWDHNNTPTFKYYPSTTHIHQYDQLAMIDTNGPWLGSSESAAKSFKNRVHKIITASDLANGRVYTIPRDPDPNDGPIPDKS